MVESTPHDANVSFNQQHRVLVVEDGKSVAEVLALFFEMEGLETAVAFDGIQAVTAAEVFRPHLICMDLAMPGMDGFEAARRIRKIYKEVVIVALCGWVDESSRERATEAGFDHYLTKPVSPDDLRELIVRYLSNANLPTSLHRMAD